MVEDGVVVEEDIMLCRECLKYLFDFFSSPLVCSGNSFSRGREVGR